MRFPPCRPLQTTMRSFMQLQRSSQSKCKKSRIFFPLGASRWSRTIVAAAALTSPAAAFLSTAFLQPSATAKAWWSRQNQSRSILFSEIWKGNGISYCGTRHHCHQSIRHFSTTRTGTDVDSDAARQTEAEKNMTKDAIQIIKSAIESVSPYEAVKSHFRVVDGNVLTIGGSGNEQVCVDMNEYGKIAVIAFGKASSAMASAVVQQMGNLDPDATSGLVICKDDHATNEERELLGRHNIKIRYASHPVPDARSSEAAQEMIDLVLLDSDKCGSKRLVICCISGGGSALFCSPHSNLTLQDLKDTNAALLASGIGIDKLNVIRKRLERGKGGRLAQVCHKKRGDSRLVTLVLSDVLGDPLDLIASGPTVPDLSSWKDAWDIVERYKGLKEKLPASVVQLLKEGLDGTQPDSPSPTDACFDPERTTNILVGNNQVAVEAAAQKAKELGYKPVILGNHVEGEAKDVAHVYTAMALYLQQSLSKGAAGDNIDRKFAIASSLPVALIAGGETTVTITAELSSGKGGRNQELALSAAVQLEALRLRNVVLASVGTDGTDGPTNAAGAVVDASTISTSKHQALEALRCHNAYPYLDAHTNLPLIKTGPTGTNVADVCVTLVQAAPEELT